MFTDGMIATCSRDVVTATSSVILPRGWIWNTDLPGAKRKQTAKYDGGEEDGISEIEHGFSNISLFAWIE
jgi:hypothetical protein